MDEERKLMPELPSFMDGDLGARKCAILRPIAYKARILSPELVGEWSVTRRSDWSVGDRRRFVPRRLESNPFRLLDRGLAPPSSMSAMMASWRADCPSVASFVKMHDMPWELYAYAFNRAAALRKKPIILFRTSSSGIACSAFLSPQDCGERHFGQRNPWLHQTPRNDNS